MRIALAGVLAAALLATGGCETVSNDQATVVDVGRRHPIVVTSQTVRLPVFLAAGTLPSVDRDRLASFVDEFIRAGGGVLEIAAPQALGREAAIAQASVIRDVAVLRGVRPFEVQLRLSDEPPSAPIVVSYERFLASVPACGDFSHHAAADSRNLPHSNYGCAYQSNLAAMVANPADFVQPRGETPPDAERKSRVLQAYRAGRQTEGELGPMAQRIISRMTPGLF